MEQRSFLTFDAPEPSPAEDADGDPQPVGRELAAALVAGIEKRGLPIVEPLDEHDSYGWYFVVGCGDEQRVWCMLQLSDKWLVVTKPEVPLLKRLLGKRVDPSRHHRVCEALHFTAAEHPEISNLRWFTRAEFERQDKGAEVP